MRASSLARRYVAEPIDTTMGLRGVFSLWIFEALEVIAQRLQHDHTLAKRTTLEVEDICKLTEVCLKSTYFQYQDSYYEQIEGVAMGSQLSPIVANIYMEYFEEMALDSAQLRPKVWKRCVDDTFV